MRTITYDTVVNQVARLCQESNMAIEPEIVSVLEEKFAASSGLEHEMLQQIVANNKLAQEKQLPLCQDTGIVVVFLEVGTDLHVDFDLEAAVNAGVAEGYTYLRKSVVGHPLARVNTKDNTPAIIHQRLVAGDKLTISLAPKGAGSENMSGMKMLSPSAGFEGVKEYVLEVIKAAKGKACPPMIVGVGIGGNFEKAPMLAKSALLRPLADEAEHPLDQKLEQELLSAINELGIGTMGVGGIVTALAVKVNSFPCHIASLPVAVNIQCHVARHLTVVL